MSCWVRNLCLDLFQEELGWPSSPSSVRCHLPFLGYWARDQTSVDLDQGYTIWGQTGLRSYVAGSLPSRVSDFHQPFFPRSFPHISLRAEESARNGPKYCQACSPHQSKALEVIDNHTCEQWAIFFSVPEKGGPQFFLIPFRISIFFFFFLTYALIYGIRETGSYAYLI